MRGLTLLMWFALFTLLVWFHFRKYILWARDTPNIENQKKKFGGFYKNFVYIRANIDGKKFNKKKKVLKLAFFFCRWIMPCLWRQTWERSVTSVYNSDGFWPSLPYRDKYVRIYPQIRIYPNRNILIIYRLKHWRPK